MPGTVLLQVWKALDEAAQSDFAFDAGEGGAEADVDACDEGDVAVWAAGDVETVWVFKLFGVAVCACD